MVAFCLDLKILRFKLLVITYFLICLLLHLMILCFFSIM